MRTIESKIIVNEFEVIDCKYYEIESICKNLITKYCLESEEHEQEFIEFSKPYKKFRPYLDFALIVLKIKIVNPLMESEKVLYAIDDKLYLSKVDDNSNSTFYFTKCDDETLNIYPIGYDASKYQECIIDGKVNHILPSTFYGHVQMLEQILNLFLISNENIAKDYLNSPNVEVGFFLSRYFPLIRFQADHEGNFYITKCFYREKNKTKEMDEFIEYLLDNHYAYSSTITSFDKYDEFDQACDLSDELKYKENNSKGVKI